MPEMGSACNASKEGEPTPEDVDDASIKGGDPYAYSFFPQSS